MRALDTRTQQLEEVECNGEVDNPFYDPTSPYAAERRPYDDCTFSGPVAVTFPDATSRTGRWTCPECGERHELNLSA